MSKAVTPDHEFRIDTYADLLSKAQGGRTQTEFAQDCGLSTAYICKHLNRRIDKAPIPSTLKKIAAVAANGVTYEELLEAAGYDSLKYANSHQYQNSPLGRKLTKNIEFVKIAIATITAALSKSNIKWYIRGNADSNTPYDLDVELKDNEITHWYFQFIDAADEQQVQRISFLQRLYAYYGRLALMPYTTATLYTFVTDSPRLFEILLENTPPSLAMYASVILIDPTSLSVVRSENIKTAFSNNSHNLPQLLPDNTKQLD